MCTVFTRVGPIAHTDMHRTYIHTHTHTHIHTYTHTHTHTNAPFPDRPPLDAVSEATPFDGTMFRLPLRDPGTSSNKSFMIQMVLTRQYDSTRVLAYKPIHHPCMLHTHTHTHTHTPRRARPLIHPYTYIFSPRHRGTKRTVVPRVHVRGAAAVAGGLCTGGTGADVVPPACGEGKLRALGSGSGSGSGSGVRVGVRG